MVKSSSKAELTLPSQLSSSSLIAGLGFRRPSWLIDVDSSGSVWTIEGGFSPKEQPHHLELDARCEDGEMLSSPRYRQFFDVLVAYALQLRLVRPSLTAKTHVRAVNDLKVFALWLAARGVRSFAGVKKDHVVRYTESICYGVEWALERPHALVELFREMAEADRAPPRKRSRKFIDRKALRKLAGTNKETGPLSAKVVRWIELSVWPPPELNDVDDVFAAAGISPTKITVGALERLLAPLEDIYLWRQSLNAPTLQFVPFEKGSASVAVAYGRPVGKTKTIPPKLAFAFLGLCAKVVLEIAPLAAAARSGESTPEQITLKLKELGFSLQVKELESYILVNRRVVSPAGLERLVAAACFGLIAGFTARRKEEINDLGAGCIENDEFGKSWLRIWIEKTLLRYELVPVPAIVRTAVTTMESISAEARRISAKDSIWQTLKDEKPTPIRAESHLNILALLGGTFEVAGRSWRFSPHQFRRFFAMLYFWRYDPGELGAISHHLRHFDLEMTKRYLTDDDAVLIFQEIGVMWRGDLLRKVIEGSRSASGPAGDRLKKAAGKLFERFRRSVDVVPVNRVVDWFQVLASRVGSEFKQHVWGTVCACPSNTKMAQHAKCKGSMPAGPDFANASPHSCGTCPFAIHLDTFKGAAAAALADAEAEVANNQPTLLRELRKDQIISLKNLIARGATLEMVEAEPELS